MKPYADTNFFAYIYLKRPESAEAEQMLSAARQGDSSPIPVIWLHRVELANALQLSVFRGKQPGQPRVSPEQSAVAWADFRDDLDSGTFLRTAHADPAELESTFHETALRHTAKFGFRTYDLLHVSAARVLGCDHFFSFDDRARKLASLEGLRVAP